MPSPLQCWSEIVDAHFENNFKISVCKGDAKKIKIQLLFFNVEIKRQGLLIVPDTDLKKKTQMKDHLEKILKKLKR